MSTSDASLSQSTLKRRFKESGPATSIRYITHGPFEKLGGPAAPHSAQFAVSCAALAVPGLKSVMNLALSFTAGMGSAGAVPYPVSAAVHTSPVGVTFAKVESVMVRPGSYATSM